MTQRRAYNQAWKILNHRVSQQSTMTGYPEREMYKTVTPLFKCHAKPVVDISGKLNKPIGKYQPTYQTRASGVSSPAAKFLANAVLPCYACVKKRYPENTTGPSTNLWRGPMPRSTKLRSTAARSACETAGSESNFAMQPSSYEKNSRRDKRWPSRLRPPRTPGKTLQHSRKCTATTAPQRSLGMSTVPPRLSELLISERRFVARPTVRCCRRGRGRSPDAEAGARGGRRAERSSEQTFLRP